MRALSDVLAFRANGRGMLQLAVRTESVALETTWTNCTNPKMGLSTPYCRNFLNSNSDVHSDSNQLKCALAIPGSDSNSKPSGRRPE
jgi:hypothetical protein